MIAQYALAAMAIAAGAKAQVTASGTMGTTNPPAATMGTAMNQSSMARLVSLNAIDDLYVPISASLGAMLRKLYSCLFAPPEPNSVIGNTEGEEVAWCVRKSMNILLLLLSSPPPTSIYADHAAEARNNARVIPDGTFTAVHFVKTPLYWQIQGFGDFTKINIASGDEGGELDPHGATGLGNPVGGNVTTNATGADVSYEEWMK